MGSGQIMCVFLFFILLIPVTSNFAARKARFELRDEVIIAHNGAVATDDRRCSEIGTDVLRDGGNAVDASVAATLCLGVVSPASSGIGGGAFMLTWKANGEVQIIDMRETAPQLASQNMYAGNSTLKATGALSIAVPGLLAGLYEAWNQHGRLPWWRLVRPAEHFACNGFKIMPYLYEHMIGSKERILRDEGLRSMFTSNGSLLKPGDMCYNKKLARTLRIISKYGLKPFYNGTIGVNLVKDVQDLGGILTMKDLQRYPVRMRTPTSANVMGLTVLSMPPPSSGGASMTLILSILSQYGIPRGVFGSIGIHRTIEALKHAYAVRMNLGDPDFINVTKVVSDMLSPEYAKQLKKTIYDNMTFGPSHYGGRNGLRWKQVHDHGTSHVCVIDSECNAVSMSSTVNAFFGSGILSPSTGIILNNEMDDFSMPSNDFANSPRAAPVNFIRPGKRPLSSMTPTIILKEGHLKAVIGASGGSLIIAATTEVLLNHFAKGMDPFLSVMAPRFYHELIPNVVHYENWTAVSRDHFELPEHTRKALRKKGHVLQRLDSVTACQFIVQSVETATSLDGTKSIGELVAVSDPRKGGFPAGY